MWNAAPRLPIALASVCPNVGNSQITHGRCEQSRWQPDQHGCPVRPLCCTRGGPWASPLAWALCSEGMHGAWRPFGTTTTRQASGAWRRAAAATVPRAACSSSPRCDPAACGLPGCCLCWGVYNLQLPARGMCSCVLDARCCPVHSAGRRRAHPTGLPPPRCSATAGLAGEVVVCGRGAHK